MSNKEKIPPQDIEVEKCVLGSLLLDRNALLKIVDFLQPQDFYLRAHQIIYETILELFEKNEAIDFIILTNSLKNKKELENIGGRTYLTSCIDTVTMSSNVFDYAKIIQKKRVLRDLIATSYEISQLGFKEDEDIDTLLDKAEQKIFSITQSFLSQDFLPIKKGLERAFERIEKISQNSEAYRGVPTGFTDLDNLLAGLQKADLIILAARPSFGKSALALDIARNVAINQNIPVGIFSLEMSNDQVIDRILSAEAEVSLWKLRTGHLSTYGEENDFTKISNALGRLATAPIFINDAASSNILQMRAITRRLQAKNGLGLIIVDYLQLMEPKISRENMVQQVTEISRSLKGLAKELNVPVLALSQLSRAVEQRPNKRPRLADLRESGSLEQDADVVMFIYREDKYKENSLKKNIADIIVAKHRNGPIGKKSLYFDEESVSFKNLSKEEIDSIEETEEEMF